MVDEKKDVTTKEVEEKKEAPTEEKVEAKPADAKSSDAAKEEKKEEVKKEEPKTEEKPADAKSSDAAKEEEVEVPKEFKKLVEQIETMSVLELHELVKVLEKKFGVSAAAVAVAGPAGGDEGGAEEKTEFNVELISDGGAKIPTMKVVKEILGLGLKEAKDLVEGVPSVLKEGVKKEEAEEMKKKIEEAGGKVELK